MDFVAQILAKLDTTDAERKLKELTQNHEIKLKVDFGNDVDGSFSRFGSQAGKAFSIAFNKNFDSALDFAKVKNQFKKYTDKISEEIQREIDGVSKKDADKWASEYARKEQQRNEKADKEAKKLQEERRKDTKKNLDAEKKLAVQQRIAEMKQNASNKNAKHNSVVESGKKLIEDTRKRYAEDQKLASDMASARIKSQENASKREQKSVDAQNKAINKALDKRYHDEQKLIEDMEKARLKSQADAAKREKAITDAQNKAINKGLEDSYKEKEKKQKSQLDDTKKNADALKKLQVQQQIATMKQDAKNKNSKSNEWTNRIKQTIEETQAIRKEQLSIEKELNDYSTRSTKLENADLSKYENTASYEKIKSNLNEIKILQDSVSNERAKPNADIDKINSDLKKMNTLLKESERSYDNLTKPITSLEASIASNKTLSWLKNNTKATKELGDAFELLAQKQRQATTRGELESYNKEFNNLVSKAKASGLTGKTMLGDMKRAFGQIAQFTSIYGIIQNVIEEVPRQMVQNVIQVDDAMTNLRMATSVSTEEAKRLMSTYSEMGRELKATSTDIAASATDWLKQGKTIKEANQLTEDAIVLSKIGDMSSEDATKTITAAMKSYKMSADEVMGFVDQISAIDMASATDVGGLSDAFNEVAANARLAGVETEKLLSYAAVIGETSQEGMSGVGTALNAIFSRMGNIKLSRLKDYENGGEDLSNVETVLRKNGIALRDAEGQFREFDEVLDETASKWENFDSVTRRAVGNAFAGTHHANSFAILMEQYGQAQKYMDIANNSSGESMEKFSAYQESLAGSIEGFKNSFQGLSNTVISSDFLTNVIDAGTTLLDLLNSLIDNFGILQTLFGGFAIGKGITSFVKGFDKSVLVIRLG